MCACSQHMQSLISYIATSTSEDRQAVQGQLGVATSECGVSNTLSPSLYIDLTMDDRGL